MRNANQNALRTYARARDDYQSMRKRMDNRIGRKADGTKQDLKDKRHLDSIDIKNFEKLADNARAEEKEIEKMIKEKLESFDVWNQWMIGVKGVGAVSAAWILGEFDIEIATNVSKLTQYAGLNSDVVRGQKAIKEKDYKPDMGEVVGELPDARDGAKRLRVVTDNMIRGDKLTEGFLAPFNKRLRTALVGVLADSFIKSRSDYANDFYYPYKKRLENSSKISGDGKKAWKDVSKGHRDRAAKRYMIKEFLKNLYAAWRQAEGLEVRKPYAEEYLGIVHNQEPKNSKNTSGPSEPDIRRNLTDISEP